MEEMMIKRAALYIRVSTDRQAQEGDSLREQEETLCEYAKAEGYRIIGTYIDNGISGQKLKERDELERLLADIKNDLIDIVLFTKLDRFFRNVRHYLNTMETLEKHHVSWFAVREPHYNTTTAAGKMIVNVSMSFAEMEAQMDSERIKAVFRNKVKNGEVITGNVPIGYMIKDKHLVKSSSAILIKEAFQEYCQEPNLKRLMLDMRKKGENHMYHIWRKILTDKIYIGEYRDNATFCEPIIDKETFDKVQFLLKRNNRENKAENRIYIFTGMIYCTECGCRYAALKKHCKTKLKDGSIKKHIYYGYRCPKNHMRKECDNAKIIMESTVQKYLLQELKPLLSKHVNLEIEESKKCHNGETESEINALKRKIDRLKDLYVNEMIDFDAYKKDREKYLAIIASKTSYKPPNQKSLSIYRDLLKSDLQGIYNALDAKHKRQFWIKIIDKITISKNGIESVSFL